MKTLATGTRSQELQVGQQRLAQAGAKCVVGR